MNNVIRTSFFTRLLAPALIVALLVNLSFVPAADAATDGPRTADFVDSISESNAPSWQDVYDARTSNNDHAYVNLGDDWDDSNSEYLKFKDFDFAIPVGAVIDGIVVSVERKGQGNDIEDRFVRIVKNDVIGSADRATSTNWTASDSTMTYGSATDKWGHTWTAADINSTNFGFAIAARNTHSTSNRTAEIDAVSITVHYSTASAPEITLLNATSTVPTNQNVTINATSTGGTLNTQSHTFTANGSFNFVAVGAGGTTTKTVVVSNIDKTAPVIAPKADLAPVEATSASGAIVTYTNPTATDNMDVSVAVNCAPASGSVFAHGSSSVICNATDTAGNSATSTTFNVSVVDTTAPTIVLNGLPVVIVQAGTSYSDAGATAQDNSGNFPATLAGSVNTNVLGTTTLTYTATDAYGNAATPVERLVVVIDTVGPVAPSIIFPTNNAILTSSALAQVDWNDATDVSNPITYFYQSSLSSAVDGNGALVTPVYASGALSASEIATGGTPEGVYYLQVKAVDGLGNEGAWGALTKVTVDNTAPVITLIGANPTYLEGGAAYVEEGANATDAVDGVFAATPSGSVNNTVLGTSTITYSATDTAGNAATPVTRDVVIVDTTAPVITLNGAATSTLEAGTAYVELGATVSDNLVTPISPVITGTVNNLVPGTYVLTYNATDGSGNAAAPVTRTIEVVDTTAPVMTVIGANPIAFTVGNTYTEFGAFGTDIVDGIISATASGTVDMNTIGNYTVTYTATDSHGNSASTTRLVIVIVPDTTAPIITLLGSDPVTVEGGTTYVDAGATANDNINGDITSAIVRVNPVNTGVVGTYVVTYNVSDGAGNAAAEVTRTVSVVDTTAPTLTLIGASTLNIHTGDTYVELGATTTDNVSTSTPVIITGGPVDTSAPNTFILTYTATDEQGNSTSTTRTVNVVDVSIPLITLNGNATEYAEAGTAYVDPGATSIDDVDGPLSVSVSGSVDTNVIGSYELVYSVIDSSMNAASTTRTVIVQDTTAPVVTLNGSSSLNIILGNTYTEEGATATDSFDTSVTTASTTDSVDVNTAGTYVLTYFATDSSGNTGTTTRTVTVSAAPDTEAPVITLNGPATANILLNATYTDLGATATDNVDGAVAVTVSGSVNTAAIGTYFIHFNAVDTSGNHAVEVTRTVNVSLDSGSGTSTSNGGFAPQTSASGQAPTTGGATGSSLGSVLGSSTFQFNKNLKKGMKGDDVLELQKRLVSEGFLTATPNGYFGNATFAAVKAYQKAKGIKPASGFVGPITRAELNK